MNFEMSSQDAMVKFVSDGEIHESKISFTDDDFSKHTIICQDSSIDYFKIGAMDMNFRFDINRVTKGIYKIDNNILEFSIITTKLENTGNRLCIEYELLHDNEVVNVSKLVINYSVTEEEFRCKA